MVGLYAVPFAFIQLDSSANKTKVESVQLKKSLCGGGGWWWVVVGVYTYFSVQLKPRPS